MSKTAVVLFNLGGPDSPKAIRPFLFNLFNDRAIIKLPQPLRFIAAKLISTLRARKAKAIYQQLGGKSPILEFTQAQATALEEKLKGKGEYKIFTCMRYWSPRSDSVAMNVKAYQPDRVLLLPLYPQFSTTTTGSSFADWERAAHKAKLDAPTARICCYPADRTFIAAHIKLLKDVYWKAAEEGKPRLLFSAHGLPEKVVREGDPYQWQVEKTVAAIVQILAIDELDYAICYQSRVGPMKWLEPSIQEEIARAGEDRVPVVVVPVAFVSEHSETLVELDVECRKLANEKGVPAYFRSPTLSTEPMFIEALADICTKVAMPGTHSFNKERFCPRGMSQCPCDTETEEMQEEKAA